MIKVIFYLASVIYVRYFSLFFPHLKEKLSPTTPLSQEKKEVPSRAEKRFVVCRSLFSYTEIPDVAVKVLSST